MLTATHHLPGDSAGLLPPHLGQFPQGLGQACPLTVASVLPKAGHLVTLGGELKGWTGLFQVRNDVLGARVWSWLPAGRP